ncbi:hypothetical protein AA0117_g4306 [Alternaria alternata]|uniref:Uncharacterized protein n=2 Tax=Alternaria alternata complex TaxID=187734 RepID=A0A4Q4NJY8_ALTAL|nr:hypothetical protein AA0114_g4363 [Alternaria tenuissima]RYN78380.1 hypothetical protein AA0117_g4306 [Alternaria alternata]
MKFTLTATVLVLAGIAQASYDSKTSCEPACEEPELDPDRFANICCTDTSGVTFPDGRDRPGSWDGRNGECRLQTDGLGFTLNQMINAWAPCCRSTGPQGPNGEDLLWGGNCNDI